jgi:hypothetical protein
MPTAHVEPIVHLPTLEAFTIIVAFFKPKAENLTLENFPALAAHVAPSQV